MPEPQPKEITKVIDQVPHIWRREADPDGVMRRRGHWEPIPADPATEQANWERAKTTAMIGGGMMGGMALPALLPALAEAGPIGAALTRIVGAAMGGGGGRAAAHVPEAIQEQRTGRPSGSTFAGEGARGAAEMATAEALPIALGPVTSTAGTVLKWLGRMGLDNPAATAAARALMAQRRGWLAAPISYMLGGGTGAAVETAATLGPVVASQTGKALEALGPRLGTETLSQRLEGPLRALVGKFGVDPTKAEALAAGAENYAANAEPWRVPKPFPAARAEIPTRTNPTGFLDADPALAAERGAADVLGERARGVGNVGVPKPAAPPPRRTKFNYEDWTRGGPAGLETPGPRQSPNSFTPKTWRDILDPAGTPDLPAEPNIRVRSEGFPGGSPEAPPPPDVRVRSEGVVGAPEPPSGAAPDVTYSDRGVTGPRDYPPPDVVPEVTVDPRGVTGPREYAPSGEAPDVSTGEPFNLELDSLYGRDPAGRVRVMPEGRSNPGAGAVDAMIQQIRNVRQTPHGFDIDLTGPTVVGGPAPAGAAADLPANLTPDELVRHYEQNYPARGAAPRDAAEVLAEKLGTPTDAEATASRLFKGNLDNEFASTANQVTIPEPQVNDALAYLRKRGVLK